MGATVAISAIICVLSFFTVLFLAWRAPEMDDHGRLITGRLPDFIASPSIVPLSCPQPKETSCIRVPANTADF